MVMQLSPFSKSSRWEEESPPLEKRTSGVTSPFLIKAISTDSVYDVKVAALTGGRKVAVWRVGSNGIEDILGKILDADNSVYLESLSIVTAFNTRKSLTSCPLDDGNLFTAWEFNSTTVPGGYGEKTSSTGTELVNSFTLSELFGDTGYVYLTKSTDAVAVPGGVCVGAYKGAVPSHLLFACFHNSLASRFTPKIHVDSGREITLVRLVRQSDESVRVLWRSVNATSPSDIQLRSLRYNVTNGQEVGTVQDLTFPNCVNLTRFETDRVGTTTKFAVVGECGAEIRTRFYENSGTADGNDFSIDFGEDPACRSVTTGLFVAFQSGNRVVDYLYGDDQRRISGPFVVGNLTGGTNGFTSLASVGSSVFQVYHDAGNIMGLDVDTSSIPPAPTPNPSPEPSPEPSPSPSLEPTPLPSLEPTPLPPGETFQPSPSPTGMPTLPPGQPLPPTPLPSTPFPSVGGVVTSSTTSAPTLTPIPGAPQQSAPGVSSDGNIGTVAALVTFVVLALLGVGVGFILRKRVRARAAALRAHQVAQTVILTDVKSEKPQRSRASKKDQYDLVPTDGDGAPVQYSSLPDGRGVAVSPVNYGSLPPDRKRPDKHYDSADSELVV